MEKVMKRNQATNEIFRTHCPSIGKVLGSVWFESHFRTAPEKRAWNVRRMLNGTSECSRFAITNMKPAQHSPRLCSVRMLFASCPLPPKNLAAGTDTCNGRALRPAETWMMVKCETTTKKNVHEHSYCCCAVMASLLARRPQPELYNLFEFNDSANY